MFYLRLFSANEEELQLLNEDTMSYFHKRITDSKKNNFITACSLIDLGNEQAACIMMEKIAFSLLGQYPEQDLHPVSSYKQIQFELMSFCEGRRGSCTRNFISTCYDGIQSRKGKLSVCTKKRRTLKIVGRPSGEFSSL